MSAYINRAGYTADLFAQVQWNANMLYQFETFIFGTDNRGRDYNRLFNCYVRTCNMMYKRGDLPEGFNVTLSRIAGHQTIGFSVPALP